MQKTKIIFLLLFGLLSIFVVAQELPPIQDYSSELLEVEHQNWSISQSESKHIYVANNKGLLEFNGAKWTLYPTPNKTILRSVHVVDSRVYTGCYMDFGYWEQDAFGKLQYTSLYKDLDIPSIEDEQFWKIVSLDNWILFQSLNRIVIYNLSENSFKTIDSNTRLTKIYKVDDIIYFQKMDAGIFKIENGLPQLVLDNDIVKKNIVVNIFQHHDSYLIETQEKGFYIYSQDNLKQWDIPANDILLNSSVYSSIQLEDKSFALGTISNGIIHITPDGEINYQINHTKGLANNTVLSLFEDKDNNIWLGLDNGINCLNSKSPFRIFNDADGYLGTIYASAIYKDHLYLGTNQGLFYKKRHQKENFKFIEGTKGQVWCLVNLNETLFCGHNNGTFVVNGNQIKKVSNIQGTWDIHPIKDNPSLLLQGNYDGLHVLEKTNNGWQYRNKIQDFNISSRYFEFVDNLNLLVSHEYKGVFKVNVNNELTKALQVTKDSSIEKGLNSSLIKYNGDILYTYKAGVFKYDSSNKTFKRDSTYSKIFDSQGYTSGKLVVDQNTNRLWSFTDKGLNYFSPGKLSSTPKINKISLPSALRHTMTGFENIKRLDNQKYLFGASTGYILIDLDRLQEDTYQIGINKIYSNKLNDSLKSVNINNEGEFHNEENNITFFYRVAEFYKYNQTEYSYQLIGLHNHWSPWSTEHNIAFNNLPYGDYTFNVKARISNTITNNIASYKFSIARPWYLSTKMIIVYILGFVFFSLLMHNIYKRYYKRQREKLLKKTQQELDLKKLENEQQLMSFENEKLQQDIANKNRELAISTMSLIKKNEFLNNIKKELKVAENESKIKSVIKIIDKNLNNTDDWKFFQEAFNNADKDFLKKVKAIHPSLTPNDLRLCAYLRLNLSSKEIAPLLNISPRSVEVKRYRLRKKMSLEHEISLTNYILEL